MVVIGGGAAGFMAAITCASQNSDLNVSIIERHSRFLSKVKVSGGGRCNVTNDCIAVPELLKHYPRGEKGLLNVFARFAVADTIAWYNSRGVSLKTEADGRMFPQSNSSDTIIECLNEAARNSGVKLCDSISVKEILTVDGKFLLKTNRNDLKADYLVIACGGFPKMEQYDFIKRLGHTAKEPVPSLFTFNIPDKEIHKLSGVSFKNVEVRIPSVRQKHQGAILITHWGLSGPAILKTSAWAARELFDCNYEFEICVNWLNLTEEQTRELLKKEFLEKSKTKITNVKISNLPSNFWQYLLYRANIFAEKLCAEIGKSDLNKLVQLLYRCTFEVKGKSTFKEEFVTAGGIPLNEVDMKTMQSKKVPRLFFAGEILDIDGVTGGFNFQAAWSTGWLAGNSIATQMG